MEKAKNIKQFIANMVDKNYSKANEALQKAVEDKFKEKIKYSLNNTLKK